MLLNAEPRFRPEIEMSACHRPSEGSVLLQCNSWPVGDGPLLHRARLHVVWLHQSPSPGPVSLSRLVQTPYSRRPVCLLTLVIPSKDSKPQLPEEPEREDLAAKHF